MANDTPSRPASNKKIMRPRDVPVGHDEPRLNDQRKVRPHTVGAPTLGNRPSGGAQKAPKAPPDKLNKSYIQARDVPMATMTEAEIAEWNPFSGRTYGSQSSSDYAIGYENTPDGLSLSLVKDGKIVATKRYDTRQILNKKLQDLNAQYAELKYQRSTMSINPTKVAKMAAHEFAKEQGISTKKFGVLGKDVPVDNGAQPDVNRLDPTNRSNRPSPTMQQSQPDPFAAPPSPAASPAKSDPTQFSIDSGPSSPLTGNRAAFMNRRNNPTASHPSAPMNGSGGRPTSRNPAAPKPPPTMAHPNAGPTDGPGGMPTRPTPPPSRNSGSNFSQSLGGEFSPQMSGTASMGSSRMAGPAMPAHNSDTQKQVLSQMNPQKYTPKVLAGMTPHQIQLAFSNAARSPSEYRKESRRKMAREGYPDTNIEHGEEPFHQSRIGDQSWDGHLRKRVKNPTPPASNREFIQARDLSVERISEKADLNIDEMLERTLTRMGLRAMMEDDDEGGFPFHDESDDESDDSDDKETDDKKTDDKEDDKPQWNFQKKKKQTESAIPRTRTRWV